MSTEQYDAVIVGAGFGGIGAAIQDHDPVDAKSSELDRRTDSAETSANNDSVVLLRTHLKLPQVGT
ncbi:hypothetical protein MAHJHV55_54300 [Mycobacterium avium subsp. hominissuis]